MDSVMLPASILLYIAGATAVTSILVNGIRTAIVLPAVVSFLGACVLGVVFVVLFAIANGVTMTGPIWAGSVIAGVMVGGASAGANAVHARSLPTTAPMPPDADPPAVTMPTVDEIVDALLARQRAEKLAASRQTKSVPEHIVGLIDEAEAGRTSTGNDPGLISKPPRWEPARDPLGDV